MAIKHVVTRGFGFSDGTKFIPTLGYTPGISIPGVKQSNRYDIAGVDNRRHSIAGVDNRRHSIVGQENTRHSIQGH